MRLRELQTIFQRECIHLLRDRHTLIYSVAIPVFLYPTLLFCIFQALAVVKGWNDRQVARVAVAGEAPEGLLDALRRVRGIEVVDGAALGAGGGAAGDIALEAERAIRDGRLDAVLSLSGSIADGLQAALVFSSIHTASAAARGRIDEALDDWQDRLLRERAAALGVGAAGLDLVRVVEEDVAPGEKKANYLLSMTMPLLMVVILLMGAFYPALDATTGERERRTIETTLVSPVSRTALVLGKYLAVVTLALMAFALNFLSMTFSFKHLIGSMKVRAFTISPASLAIIVAGAVLLALFLAAVMMAIAYLARSFKEGQSYMAPVYLLGLAPVLVSMSPDVPLTPLLSALPIVNVTMVFREVLQDRIDPVLIAVTLVSSAVYTILAISAAAWIVSRESFLFGDGVSPLSRLWGRLAGSKDS